MLGFSRKYRETPEVVAAVDLGSNSFHMIVARVVDGHLQVIDRLREMVRLGAGLTRDRKLTPESRQRAIACLERFGQRVRSLPQGSVRAVGTNTLRMVRDASAFLREAEAALGHPIEIIAGREEARLVYLGVAQGLAAGEGNRLVIDIGGGSTEAIIGQGFDTLRRESLHMGCVSMSLAQFKDGRITRKAMDKARIASRLQVSPIETDYRRLGWDTAVGSSGTIRSIQEVVQAAGWSQGGISIESMYRLRDELLAAGHVDKLKLAGLSEERRPVFTGGFTVLLGVFEALGIERMQVSDEALREGLIYDLMGRIRHEDTRERTVAALKSRYDVDTTHADRVAATALSLLEQVAAAWSMSVDEFGGILNWAAQLHEIGLAVSHSRYQHHGAYLLRHADLSGFSRQEQSLLSAIVLGHRRKFPMQVFRELSDPGSEPAVRLCVLLRLAVLLNRSRDDAPLPDLALRIEDSNLVVRFPDTWLEQHPLTSAELKLEAGYLKPAGIKLAVE